MKNRGAALDWRNGSTRVVIRQKPHRCAAVLSQHIKRRRMARDPSEPSEAGDEETAPESVLNPIGPAGSRTPHIYSSDLLYDAPSHMMQLCTRHTQPSLYQPTHTHIYIIFSGARTRPEPTTVA